MTLVLQVFFNDNTQKFVNELFECLESKAYLEPYGSKGSADRIKKEPDEQVDKVRWINNTAWENIGRYFLRQYVVCIVTFIELFFSIHD